MTPLRRADLDPDPLRQFARWHADARAAGVAEPDAMALATASAAGRPSARMVLLKGFDERGFRFFTGLQSRKSDDLRENPLAALLFHWPGRQVRIEGTVAVVSGEEADEYFRTRPAGSRLSAAVSPQSRPVAGRETLERAVAELRARYPDGDVPRPEHWGGYRLAAEAYDFWQHGDDRLHDRFRYTRGESGWVMERLGP